MQIQSHKKTVQAEGFENETSTFRIKSSSMAFKILSDKLYSDKPLAVLRELGCNAYDAHIAAKNSDTPFDVHLPNSFEPWFAIRDYGTGLSEHDIFNLYTTYFESTKSDSNEFVGALGLGSKSPFSYVDQFTVVSFFGKMKKTYSAFISELGTPSITKVSEEITDEPVGVEIRMMVQQGDFGSFADRAKRVFHRFPVAPKITGNKVDLTTIKYSLVGPNYKLRSEDDHERHDGTMAIQGTVAYPINVNRIDIPMSSAERSLIEDLPIDIMFPIGELDISPSREELSYDKRTQANIIKAVKSVLAHIPTHAADVLKDASNLWEAKLIYSEWFLSGSSKARLLAETIGKKLTWNGESITDNKIVVHLYDKAQYDQTTLGEVYSDSTKSDVNSYRYNMSQKQVEMYGEAMFWNGSQFRRGYGRGGCSYSMKPTLHVNGKIHIVFVDDKKLAKGADKFVRHNFGDGDSDVLIFKADSKYHQKIIDQLGGCPNITYTSQLEEVPKALPNLSGKVSEVKKLYKIKTAPQYNGYAEVQSHEQDVDVSNGGLYCVRYSGEYIVPGQEFTEQPETTSAMGKVIGRAHELGFFKDANGNDMQVYAINSSHKGIIKRHAGWVNVCDHIKAKWAEAIADPETFSYYTNLMLHHKMQDSSMVYRSLARYNKDWKTNITPRKANSKFLTALDEVGVILEKVKEFGIKMKGPDYAKNNDSMTDFGFTNTIDTFEKVLKIKPVKFKGIEQRPKKFSEKFSKAYPIFDEIQNGSNYRDIVHYIDLCDASPSISGGYSEYKSALQLKGLKDNEDNNQ